MFKFLFNWLFFGVFLRFILGTVFAMVVLYYLVFNRLPFAKLPGMLWDKAKSTSVQLTLEQNGSKTSYDVLTPQMMDSIDRWLDENNYNLYGDPKGTVYAGGTPTFNEVTGTLNDRYQMVIEKHPELKNL